MRLEIFLITLFDQSMDVRSETKTSSTFLSCKANCKLVLIFFGHYEFEGLSKAMGWKKLTRLFLVLFRSFTCEFDPTSNK